MDVTRNDVERMIDASLGATPAPTLAQVEEFVRKTLNYNFATTLTEPFFIRGNADILHQAGKELVSVISYPLGGMTHEAKLYYTRRNRHLRTERMNWTSPWMSAPLNQAGMIMSRKI